MTHPLADRSTPLALAESRQVFDYEGDLTDFPRLADIVEADLSELPDDERPASWRVSPVHVRLAFGFMDARETVPSVSGSAAATLTLVCQRCLEPFSRRVEAELDYVFDRSSEDEESGGAAVWELDEERFRPLDLVEEALIMVLPMVAAHASTAECGPLAKAVSADSAAGDEGAKLKPFAGLRDQMKAADELD